MRRGVVVPLLALAALGIGLENWLFFGRAGPEAAVAAMAEDSASPEGDDAALETGHEERALVSPPPILDVRALATIVAGFDALRSPFLPTGAQSSAALGIPNLSGLLIGSERRIAWLGTHARSEGELYQGYVVARIEASRVVLERDGQRFSLWLDESGPTGASELDSGPEEDTNP